MVKLRASQLNGCAYCIDMHNKDARHAGESEDRLYLLDAWREAPCYTEQERAALALTEAITQRPPSDERRDYVTSLASVTSPGGNLYVLSFSDVGPAGTCGPHPISREELKEAFKASGHWTVASVSPERLRTSFNAQGAPAWFAKIERL